MNREWLVGLVLERDCVACWNGEPSPHQERYEIVGVVVVFFVWRKTVWTYKKPAVSLLDKRTS